MRRIRADTTLALVLYWLNHPVSAKAEEAA